MNKTERYDWAKPGDFGKQCRVNVAELKIDHSYQRQEISDVNTLAIARDFSWEAFNSLTVMQRKNGDMYVVDGQQRLAAVLRRGDIQTVPCRMFSSDGREHEAAAFLALNTRRKNVSAIQKFRAQQLAEVEPAKSIHDWLTSNGFKVDHKAHDGNVVDFVRYLENTWALDAESAKKALLAQRQINHGDALHGSIHKGLWYLFHNGIDANQHIEKIVQSGGKSALLMAIRRYRIETNQNSEGEKTCGYGILSIINFRRKNKITIKATA